MANLYRKLTSDELRVLRSKKVILLNKLQSQPRGFFVRTEQERIEHQIHQIDVELTCRFHQTSMF